jgi:endonuclease/exonuclease/phosphatase family metal-dependent hydrolase
MDSIRIATFNCENLFARYKFKSNFDPTSADRFTINDVAFDVYDETEKQITAQAIGEVSADVIALQEVENLPLLDRFNSRYLASMKYKHRILVDSHDPRGIDVALLSRHPIVAIRSYRQERNKANTAVLFSRDCLEVSLDVGGLPLVFYVNHLKSMIGGREETKPKREEQAERVAAIITEAWQPIQYQGNYVVLGDLNDYPEGDTALSSLLNHEGLVNVVQRLPQAEQWTHFYAGENEYRQLDYLFLSSSLAQKNPSPPAVMRKGLPYRAERYTGERFPNIGEDNPKASDHAPLYMDISLT